MVLVFFQVQVLDTLTLFLVQAVKCLTLHPGGVINFLGCMSCLSGTGCSIRATSGTHLQRQTAVQRAEAQIAVHHLWKSHHGGNLLGCSYRADSACWENQVTRPTFLHTVLLRRSRSSPLAPGWPLPLAG